MDNLFIAVPDLALVVCLICVIWGISALLDGKWGAFIFSGIIIHLAIAFLKVV